MPYVFGGDANEESLNVVASYNPTTNQWTTRTPMPTASFCNNRWKYLCYWRKVDQFSG